MNCIDILMDSEAWLQYAVRLTLLNESKAALVTLKDQALQDTRIKAYLDDVAAFHNTVVNTHKNPDLSVNKLLFLLDIGFGREVTQIDTAIDAILSHKDVSGMYQSKVNIPEHFGGSGEDIFGWCLCDAPLMSTALLIAGVSYENKIKPGVDHMISLMRNNGFPCAVSNELGSFRGPGRKDDCCPYATLSMLKLLSYIPEYKDSDIAQACVDTLLLLWEQSRERHPYMFYMGTDFRKLKAPSVWFDIVSVADCLSQFDRAKKDMRFREMLSIIANKKDKDGLFTPESVYLKCKAWDFGQKKHPSLYLTYCCTKILQRVDKI